MEKHVLEFEFDRETKHTVRYQEVLGNQSNAVSTLYVQKWAVRGGTASGWVQRLKVTVEEGE